MLLRKYKCLMSKEIIFLQGGLGNQLFQYAFYLAKKERGANVFCDNSLFRVNSQHNGFELERVFDIELFGTRTNSLIVRFLSKMTVWNNSIFIKGVLLILNFWGFFLIEDSIPSIYFPFLLNSQKKRGIYFYLGYWQTEKYFKEIRSKILQIYSFNENLLSNDSKIILHKIEQTDSVSIHIRRGDFLSSQNESLYGGICTQEYYNKAISFILSKNRDTTFFVFSDDMDWVKDNINLSNAVYVEFNQMQDSWQDMFLMSKCQHNIIANSSFSWWGAWLNRNPGKMVICPSRFLNVGHNFDIIPSDWIIL